MKTRSIKRVFKGKPTIEGAGVHLRRVFGHSEVPWFDPFLLFDDFRSDEPARFRKGFPWHPHRGIETITYVLAGDVEHGDSLGNAGVISSGDVQWMTAGSGIIHQEMPKGDGRGRMYGFQLWANLPAAHKMMAPRYRDVRAGDIPEVTLDGGVRVRIICGAVAGARGPVADIVIEPEYLDITVPAGTEYRHPVKAGHTAMAYVIEGKGCFCREKKPFSHDVAGETYFDFAREPYLEDGSLALFDDGDEVLVFTEEEPVRLLFIAGRPIGEPVAWGGPIVMNTREELRIAFEEYENGTFIKSS